MGKVNSPSHYTWLKDLCGIEVIDITRHLDFDTGNAIKYLLRAGHKPEQGYTNTAKTIEDLQKAIWYINDKIKMLQKDPPPTHPALTAKSTWTDPFHPDKT